MPCRPVELCSLSCNHHAMAATTLGDIERITSCALWRSTRARPIGSSGAGVGAGLHYPKAVTTAGGSADAPLVYRPSLGPPKVRGEVWTTQREELWRRLSSTQRGGGPAPSRTSAPRLRAKHTALFHPSSPSLCLFPTHGPCCWRVSFFRMCALLAAAVDPFIDIASAAAGARSGRVLESHLFPGFSTPRRTDTYGAADTPSRGTSTRRYLDLLAYGSLSRQSLCERKARLWLL